MCGTDHKPSRGCRCRGGLLRGFIQPRLLLELARQPAHGYELMETLDKNDDMIAADPGNVYRMLRSLEDDGLVRSNWDTSNAGPARRVYTLTAEGIEFLDAWVVNLREARKRIDHFLLEYEDHLSTRDSIKP